MKYLAKTFIGAGGTWAKGETKDQAVKNCIKQAISDWSGLYDIKRAVREHAVEVHVYKDDTFLETVTP